MGYGVGSGEGNFRGSDVAAYEPLVSGISGDGELGNFPGGWNITIGGNGGVCEGWVAAPREVYFGIVGSNDNPLVNLFLEWGSLSFAFKFWLVCVSVFPLVTGVIPFFQEAIPDGGCVMWEGIFKGADFFGGVEYSEMAVGPFQGSGAIFTSDDFRFLGDFISNEYGEGVF